MWSHLNHLIKAFFHCFNTCTVCFDLLAENFNCPKNAKKEKLVIYAAERKWSSMQYSGVNRNQRRSEFLWGGLKIILVLGSLREDLFIFGNNVVLSRFSVSIGWLFPFLSFSWLRPRMTFTYVHCRGAFVTKPPVVLRASAFVTPLIAEEKNARFFSKHAV